MNGLVGHGRRLGWGVPHCRRGGGKRKRAGQRRRLLSFQFTLSFIFITFQKVLGERIFSSPENYNFRKKKKNTTVKYLTFYILSEKKCFLFKAIISLKYMQKIYSKYVVYTFCGVIWILYKILCLYFWCNSSLI